MIDIPGQQQSDFAAVAVGSPHQLMIHDDAAAKQCVQIQIGEIIELTPNANQTLADCRGIAVVFHPNRHVKTFLEQSIDSG